MTVTAGGLKAFGPLIDQAVAQACRGEIQKASDAWPQFEVSCGLQELANLASVDCSYDRPSFGPTYALWHHGSRTSAALRLLLPWLPTRSTPVRILDVGCGTGAASTAVSVLLQALSKAGRGASGCIGRRLRFEPIHGHDRTRHPCRPEQTA